MLEDEGKLSMQDPVAKYFPEATKGKEITLFDAATHVSEILAELFRQPNVNP